MRVNEVRRRSNHTSTKPRSGGGPLEGVRVLDLTRVLAGPVCTQLLGDMGADVVKVEHPQGDQTRIWGPPFLSGGESAYFLCCNRNKKSIAIDFSVQEGRDLVKKLAAKSDVLVHNFMPGALEKKGLGWEDLQKVNPRLIFTSISGFGETGPYKNRPGYDVICSAMAGLTGVTGHQESGPAKVGVAMTDQATGLLAAMSISSALYARHSTGKGQAISVSLFETQIALMANLASNHLLAGMEGRLLGTAHESIVPYQAFPASDGSIMIGATSDAQFDRFAAALGKPELSKNPLFATNPLRVSNREALVDIISKEVSKHPRKHWERLFLEAKVACGPINSLEEVFDDEQTKHLQVVKQVDHPTCGKVKVVGPPMRFSDTPARIYNPPPLLGQHTREILSDLLQLDQGSINHLFTSGAVRQTSVPSGQGDTNESTASAK